MSLPIDLPNSDLLIPLDANVDKEFRESWRFKEISGEIFDITKYTYKQKLMAITFPRCISELSLKTFYDKVLSNQVIYCLSIGDPEHWSFSAEMEFSHFCNLYYELSLVSENIILSELNGPCIFSSFTDSTSFGVDLELAKLLL